MMNTSFYDDTNSIIDTKTIEEDNMIEDEILSSDDQLLAQLGYRSELKREFSYLTVFGQSFGSMGIAPAIAESIAFSLGSAGTVGMVWTYLIGCILLIPVSLSLGELGSSMPTSGGLYYIGMLVALIFTLSTFTDSKLKNTPSFVFLEFQNTGAWSNNFWAFMMAFLTPVWVVSGFESAATIAEEASNAAKAVPFAMVSSLVAATFTGWAVIVTIAFCMGTDVIGIVTTPLGQPLAQIALNSLGKGGSIGLLISLWICSICNCSILMVAASRETFAFARDHGIPGSAYLRVLSTGAVPARAVGFVAVCGALEGLLMLINTIAINSIFNLAIMGLYFAYCMPLILRLVYDNFKPGVWYMGDTISYISALYSVIWMTFIFILLLFPSYQNPTLDQMNYAIIVLGSVLVFCVAYYWCPKIGGKTFFNGPLRTIDELISTDQQGLVGGGNYQRSPAQNIEMKLSQP